MQLPLCSFNPFDLIHLNLFSFHNFCMLRLDFLYFFLCLLFLLLRWSLLIFAINFNFEFIYIYMYIVFLVANFAWSGCRVVSLLCPHLLLFIYVCGGTDCAPWFMPGTFYGYFVGNLLTSLLTTVCSAHRLFGPARPGPTPSPKLPAWCAGQYADGQLSEH